MIKIIRDNEYHTSIKLNMCQIERKDPSHYYNGVNDVYTLFFDIENEKYGYIKILQETTIKEIFDNIKEFCLSDKNKEYSECECKYCNGKNNGTT